MKKFLKILVLVYVFGLVLLSMPNVSAKSYGWGFKRNNNNTCPDIGMYAGVIDGTSSYYVGNTDEKTIYLTFDAGYDNGVLSGILDVLKQKQIKSSFFVTGDFIKRESELLLRIVEEGHIVGNHTWSHKNITTLTYDQLAEELVKVEEEYSRLTQRDMLKIFRPPAGEFNRDALLNVQKLGYSTIFWSLAYKDWETDRQRGSDYTYNQVMNNIHNGAIILMHTVSESNLNALPQIIDSLRDQGYTFKNLDTLIKNGNSFF